MLRPLLLSVLMVVGCKAAPAPSSTPTTAEKDAPPTVARHGTVAEDAERQVAARRTSSYVHDTHVDEASGTFQYDCSGFVNYTLKEVAPAAFGEVAAVRARPNARSYHDFFSAVPAEAAHWHARSSTRPTSSAVISSPGSSPPIRIRRTPGTSWSSSLRPPLNAIEATRLTVDVIDSARSGHGTTDTRPKGETGARARTDHPRARREQPSARVSLVTREELASRTRSRSRSVASSVSSNEAELDARMARRRAVIASAPRNSLLDVDDELRRHDRRQTSMSRLRSTVKTRLRRCRMRRSKALARCEPRMETGSVVVSRDYPRPLRSIVKADGYLSEPVIVGPADAAAAVHVRLLATKNRVVIHSDWRCDARAAATKRRPAGTPLIPLTNIVGWRADRSWRP